METPKGKQVMGSVLTALLCLILVIDATMTKTVATSGLENFKTTASFAPTTFSDVRLSEWYYGNVKTVYELGLMVGDSATTFNPDGNVTIAEAVTLAARLHSIYHMGTSVFESSTPWYQVYVDYAQTNGIIGSEYQSYTKAATRAEYAVILAAALPDEALREINAVPDGTIPDVKMNAAYSAAVYKLYRAGVLAGNDEKGTYAPDSRIKRSEVAAVIARMANESERLLKTAVDETPQTSLPPGETSAVTSWPRFVIDTVEAKAEDRDVAVTVAVQNNPGIASVGMLVSYDEALTLKRIEYNEEIGGQYMLPQTMANPAKLVWISPFKDVGGDWVLATLYFNVAKNAAPGNHQIAITYDNEDVYNLAENNVAFNTIHGAIIVTK